MWTSPIKKDDESLQRSWSNHTKSLGSRFYDLKIYAI